jgi:hypothetical protein
MQYKTRFVLQSYLKVPLDTLKTEDTGLRFFHPLVDRIFVIAVNIAKR